MKRNRILNMALLGFVSCVFASCMDDKYNLDDVDLTLGTSSDLTLPTSSTGEIILKNIMDLQEDGVIQSVDGEYYLIEEGNANVPGVTIDPISIARPHLSDISASISVDELVNGARMSGNDGKTYGEIIPGVVIPHQVYTYTIKEKDNAYYNINVSSGNIPAEVVSLESVSFVDETTLDARMKIVFDKEHSFINKVHLDDLTLTLPKGLHVEHAEFVHWTDINASERETVSAIEIDNENGIVRLTETDESTIVDDDHVIDVLITFDKAVTSNEGFTFANNKVSLKGLFRINGTFRLDTEDFDLTKLSQEQIQEIVLYKHYDVIRPEHITFKGSAEFNKDIQVKSFGGKVQSEVGDIAPIKLDNMPDFLNDPEVCLDLANPAFFVKVENSLPAVAKTGIILSSKYDDGTPTVTIETGLLEIPAEKNVVFCLACNPAEAVVPSQYAGYEKIPVRIDNLNELLRKLPKEIQVEVADVNMEVENMPTPLHAPKEYKVAVDYQVYTPLEFGEDFKLVYQGTEEGLSEDLADVDKVDTKAIRINAVATTNFPLNLTLSVDALDRYSNSLKGSIVSVDDIVINAHKGEGEHTEQPVALTIQPMQGHTISELLQQLDKFQYRAVAQADGEEGKLTEDAYIKLTQIQITLVGGVSYDAN